MSRGATPGAEEQGSGPRRRAEDRLGLALFGVGAPAALLGAGLDPGAASAAAQADWPPFVLVAGLLLVGAAADADGLFAALGARLGPRLAPLPAFLLGMGLVATVTAVLNLDTSVTFLTPVLVHRSRRRGEDPAPLLYGCLLGSNAASLLLPGANLTNLMLLGTGRRAAAFAGAMALPSLIALGLVCGVIAVVQRRALRRGTAAPPDPEPLRLGIGAIGTLAVLVDVLVTSNPAPLALGIGVGAVAVGLGRRRLDPGAVRRALALPTLVGLFGVAVGLGTLGRHVELGALLAHLDALGAASLAAALSLVVNNLPAASLLQAAHPARPEALLVGLDLGPNAFATGSLAWLLWWRSATRAGERPSLRRAAALGLVVTPPAVVLGALALAVGGGR